MSALQGFEWLAYLSFFAAAWLRTFRLIDGAQAIACGILAGIVLTVRAFVELNNSNKAMKEAERLAEEAAASVAANEALAEELRKMNEAGR
jgi:hypothetical protein